MFWDILMQGPFIQDHSNMSIPEEFHSLLPLGSFRNQKRNAVGIQLLTLVYKCNLQILEGKD